MKRDLFTNAESQTLLIINKLQSLSYKWVTKIEYKHYFIDNQDVNNFFNPTFWQKVDYSWLSAH